MGPYLSLIVAFFYAATSGHRRAAWTSILVGYVCSCWLVPLAYGDTVASLEQALLVAGWLAVLVVGAEIRRMHEENAARRSPPGSSTTAAEPARNGCGSPTTSTTSLATTSRS